MKARIYMVHVPCSTNCLRLNTATFIKSVKTWLSAFCSHIYQGARIMSFRFIIVHGTDTCHNTACDCTISYNSWETTFNFRAGTIPSENFPWFDYMLFNFCYVLDERTIAGLRAYHMAVVKRGTLMLRVGLGSFHMRSDSRPLLLAVVWCSKYPYRPQDLVSTSKGSVKPEFCSRKD